MNFFAHAKVALWRGDHPRFVLGSMLPDLTGMLGLRVLRVDDPELAAGVAYHHATDAAFHGSPLFLELCAQGIATLSAAGVSRGPARAVAHVGTELLLDGALSHDRHARMTYTRTLEAAVRERFVDLLALEGPASARRLHDGLDRLVGAPVPEGYRDPAFVLARLQTILARRPRLAIQESELGSVDHLVRAFQPLVVRRWPELLEQVRSGLLEDKVRPD
jgi:acyl carrier protein phosphodiesterase